MARYQPPRYGIIIAVLPGNDCNAYDSRCPTVSVLFRSFASNKVEII